MSRKTSYKTRSPAGETILGVLFLICALIGLGCPCLGILGTLVGQVTPPKDRQDLLGTLCALGVTLVMAFGCAGLGLLCLHATLLPKTLHINEDGLQLFWGSKQLGAIPFANVKAIFVKTRAMAGQTADGAASQAFFTGGLIASALARSNFNPDEPIGFVVRLVSGDDPDTFWPRLGGKKRIEVHYYWEVGHPRLVEKIEAAYARARRAPG